MSRVGTTVAQRVPPHVYFVGSAVFHYLGPAFAVLLFARVEPLGVAWLRIASAALIFAAWRRPWRVWRGLDRRTRLLLAAWAAVLAVMNSCFYLAIDRLPLGTVAAIEFLPVIADCGAWHPYRPQRRRARARRGRCRSAVGRPARRRAPRFRLRRRQRRALRLLHRARAPGRAELCRSRDRRPRTGDADRRRHRAAAGHRSGRARVLRLGRAGRGHRRRGDVVGHPLRLRPARHGPADPRCVRAHGGAPPGDRDRHRSDRARQSRRSSRSSGWGSSSPGSGCTAKVSAAARSMGGDASRTEA